MLMLPADAMASITRKCWGRECQGNNVPPAPSAPARPGAGWTW
ncbi:hypothetical protein [Kibdelosporangium phytohabitans]|nr:hypothetical protein [Kibdelosporangium phytohabitans]MBE1463375.1 hypothetical protein [Kibdelosporangium phytohabitans]